MQAQVHKREISRIHRVLPIIITLCLDKTRKSAGVGRDVAVKPLDACLRVTVNCELHVRFLLREGVMNDPIPTTRHGLSLGLTNYGDPDFALYLRRSFARSMGYSLDMLSKPVIGIADTRSGFNNCHRHFPELIEAVKRGVLASGGLPMVFPTISLGEVFLSPTSLMFRNLMAIDTEEMIRAQPMDAVVLVGGCDKTVPAQLMGAISANRPAIQLVTGPMMTGRLKGERLGACTDCRRFWALYRAGEVSRGQIEEIEGGLVTTA